MPKAAAAPAQPSFQQLFRRVLGSPCRRVADLFSGPVMDPQTALKAAEQIHGAPRFKGAILCRKPAQHRGVALFQASAGILRSVFAQTWLRRAETGEICVLMVIWRQMYRVIVYEDTKEGDMSKAIAYPGQTTEDRPMGPAPLSAALRNGSFLFVSGQVGIDPATGKLAGTDIRSQTRQVLTNMKALVKAGGLSMAEVVKVGIFLVRPDDFAAMNEVYAEFFAAPYPARATVGIALNDPRLLVEMDAIAMRRE